jgi:hypothetical protein
MFAPILFILASLSFLPFDAFASGSDASKIKCAEIGAKFAASFKETYASDTSFSIWGNPEYHYSERLHTCLVYTEVIDGAFVKGVNATWYYRRITDIYSNKVLAYSRYLIRKDDAENMEVQASLINVGDAINLSSADFKNAKTRLFNS